MFDLTTESIQILEFVIGGAALVWLIPSFAEFAVEVITIALKGVRR